MEVMLESLPGWFVLGEIEGKTDSWSCSRVCVKFDGEENVTSTVLVELAKVKFPGVDLAMLKPYWVDKNWENMSLENVGLMKTESGTPDLRKPSTRKSASGLPVNSIEYQREYYRTHKEQILAAQKRYQKKRREKMREVREKYEKQNAAGAPPPVVDSYTEESSNKLLDLLGKIEAEVKPEIP